MNNKVVISGFGGQGIVFAGKLLAEAAMRGGLECTYFPSYGVAMRGGAAKCDVITADHEIGSPVIDHADVVVAMSIEAFHRYQDLIRPGGLLIVNSSLINEEPVRTDIDVVKINATALATEIGNKMVATLICLGFAAGRLGNIPQDGFMESLKQKENKFGSAMVVLNQKAVAKGWDL